MRDGEDLSKGRRRRKRVAVKIGYDVTGAPRTGRGRKGWKPKTARKDDAGHVEDKSARCILSFTSCTATQNEGENEEEGKWDTECPSLPSEPSNVTPPI